MGKKIFEVYLAKEDVPNNEAYAKLELARLPVGAVGRDGKGAAERMAKHCTWRSKTTMPSSISRPHLDGLDISLNELNDLAALLCDAGRGAGSCL